MHPCLNRYVLAILLVLAYGSPLWARTWSSASGRFTIEAEFEKLDGGAVYLRSASGKQFKIPLDKLAEEDQKFVRQHTGTEPQTAEPEQPADERLALPSPDARAESLSQIKEVYGEKFAAARSRKDKVSLAQELFQLAEKTQRDPTGRFVLLTEAGRLASEGRDPALLLQTIDLLAAEYQMDGLEQKVKGIVALGSSRGLSRSSAADEVLVSAMSLAADALELGRLAEAKQAADVASSLAASSRNYEIKKKVATCAKEIRKLEETYEAAQTAAERIGSNPADPQANLAGGVYLCLVRDEWDRGLPMLAKTDDVAHRKAAEKELAGPKTSDEQMAAGDAWWEVAELAAYEDSYFLKQRIHHRAIMWYEKAAPDQPFLNQQVIEKRTAEAEAFREQSACDRDIEIEKDEKDSQEKSKPTDKRELVRVLTSGPWTIQYLPNPGATRSEGKKGYTYKPAVFLQDGVFTNQYGKSRWKLQNDLIFAEGPNRDPNSVHVFRLRNDGTLEAQWYYNGQLQTRGIGRRGG